MKMGAMSLLAKLADSQVAEGPSESVLLTETLEHGIKVVPVGKVELPSFGRHHGGKHLVAVREHDEKEMIEPVLQVHPLDDGHLTDGYALRTMTARHTKVLTTAVLHVIETDMRKAEIRIRDQCRIRAHLRSQSPSCHNNDGTTPDTVPRREKEGKQN